jgi:hypothetical protein
MCWQPAEGHLGWIKLYLAEGYPERNRSNLVEGYQEGSARQLQNPPPGGYGQGQRVRAQSFYLLMREQLYCKEDSLIAQLQIPSISIK